MAEPPTMAELGIMDDETDAAAPTDLLTDLLPAPGQGPSP